MAELGPAENGILLDQMSDWPPVTHIFPYGFMLEIIKQANTIT